MVRRTPGGFLGGIIVGALLTYFVMESSRSPAASHRNLSSEDIVRISKPVFRVAGEELYENDEEEVTWPVPRSWKYPADMVASRLKHKVRILCCVMTSPGNVESNAIHINATWGRRCNTLLFMSAKVKGQPAPRNLSLPLIELDVPEGNEFLWEKTKAVFTHLYEQHLRSADWFFIADDATFAVVENLRYLLKDKNPDTPLYFGRRFKGFARQGYMSGGAGYVLSRTAVWNFAATLSDRPGLCWEWHGGSEDVMIGSCLEKCGVEAMDTRDELGRQRFHPLAPWDHLMNERQLKDFWLFNYDYYSTQLGPECCSDYTISFNHISPHVMYILDFLVYRIKPYGITTDCDLLDDV